MRPRGERILGPYEQPKGWRVIEVDAAGSRSSLMFETELREFPVTEDGLTGFETGTPVETVIDAHVEGAPF